MADYCPICEARIRSGSFRSGTHRCSERRLRAVEARRRRAADADPDDLDALDRLDEWNNRMAIYDDDYREDER